MSFRTSQETWKGRLDLVGKAVGLLLALGGLGMYFATDRAEPVVFTTAVLLFLGGNGVGLLDRFGRGPDPPSKEQA